MKKMILTLLATSALGLAGCATPVDPAMTPATAASAAAASACGSYGYVDINNDGWISGTEWSTYGSKTYAYWDLNRDGRIDRSEFERCYRAGGFYAPTYYNADYWTNYWTVFDTNRDGYLSPSEYWSSTTWRVVDRNGNNRVDADEWVFWPH